MDLAENGEVPLATAIACLRLAEIHLKISSLGSILNRGNWPEFRSKHSMLNSFIHSFGRIVIRLELVSNTTGDLLSYIKRNGPQKNLDAKRIFSDLCSGIAYCHSIDVVHRDMKCENLLITKENRVKIADFGFARYRLRGGLTLGFGFVQTLQLQFWTKLTKCCFAHLLKVEN